MQSGMLVSQEFAYFTITGEGNAQEIVEKYHLRPNEIHNAGDVDEEGRYVYEQMCLKYKSCGDTTESLEDHFNRLIYPSWRFTQLPDHLTRTLHAVIYGYSAQNGGFYLSRENMRRLARMKAESRLYVYKIEVEDNHEHSYAKRIASNVEPQSVDHEPEIDDFTSGESAYFRVTSDTLHADEISSILGLQPTDAQSVGDPHHRISGIFRKWTSWKLESGLPRGERIALHLEALMAKLTPHIDQLYLLSRNVDTTFGLSSTAKFPTSNQMYFSKELILQMAKLNLSLDCDLYFHYDN